MNACPSCTAQAAQIAALQGEIDTYDDIVADLRAKVERLKGLLDEEIKCSQANIDIVPAPFVALAKAVDAFEKKLAKVQEAIDGAFAFQQIHGFPYQGDNYGEEITALRDALAHPAVQRAVHDRP